LLNESQNVVRNLRIGGFRGRWKDKIKKDIPNKGEKRSKIEDK
jgi:hypothetical protein